MIRQFFQFLLVAWMWSAASVQAASPWHPLARPQPVETGARVEVIEFFSYMCPHCNALEPTLQRWEAALPKDVAFRRVPVIFRDSWAAPAAAYYTVESLGLTKSLHARLFHALHVDGVDLTKEQALFDYVARQGVDRARFSTAYASFGVQNKLKRARTLPAAYGITGVPAFVVDGKYATSVGEAGSPEALIQTLNQLVERARRERKARTR